MAPAADYVFLSIESFINSLSLVVMVPCISTLIRTQGIHENCKILLVTGASIQTIILCVQMALFAFNFITENLMPESLANENERPFLKAQNGLFTMSSYLSLALVLERTFAVWNAAKYESSKRHAPQLIIVIGLSAAIGVANVYAIYDLSWTFEIIGQLYAVECAILLISVVIIVYSRRKLRHIPFDGDRLKTKYQIREVLDFSAAILPSVMVSTVMHTLSLVPTILNISGVISYPVCCVFYFSIHSLNCILSKLILIFCHKGMRKRFMQIFARKASTPTDPTVMRDSAMEGDEYFSHMRAAWDVGFQRKIENNNSNKVSPA